MRELDVLLTSYLDTHYAASASSQKAAFRELLALPDPDLLGYVLGGKLPADAELASVITRIRGQTPG
jgi:antitoxin CptB